MQNLSDIVASFPAHSDHQIHLEAFAQIRPDDLFAFFRLINAVASVTPYAAPVAVATTIATSIVNGVAAVQGSPTTANASQAGLSAVTDAMNQLGGIVARSGAFPKSAA